MEKPRGKLISFEGGMSAGKSSQIKVLAKRLENAGYPILIVHEEDVPAGTRAVRHVLSSGAGHSLGDEMEAILDAAARGDYVEHIIKPALDKGVNVLCEKYCDNFRVLHGITRNTDDDMIRTLVNVTYENAMPDLTLILDIFPEEGMRRSNLIKQDSNADTSQKIDIVMQKARHAAYHKIAREAADRCEVIDASLRQNYVAEKVWNVITRRGLFQNINTAEKTVVADNANRTIVADLSSKTVVLGASKQ